LTEFNSFFTPIVEANGLTMIDLVSTGGSAPDWRKAARNVVAAYLNASWGMVFPYTAGEVADMWTDAADGGEGLTFLEVHNLLGSANSPPDGICPAGF
jgi:hypothetical protein